MATVTVTAPGDAAAHHVELANDYITVLPRSSSANFNNGSSVVCNQIFSDSTSNQQNQVGNEYFVEQLNIETDNVEPVPSQVSKGKTFSIISTQTGITCAISMTAGLMTVGLPQIAADIKLADNLLLWPVLVNSLSSGCTLLVAGSIADLVGNRSMNILGCLLLGIFILASGLAETGTELIIFRAFQGIASSMCSPTSFSIFINAFPNGRRRNIAFACLGLGAPFGFAVGLVLGGLLGSSAIGWRFGFYLTGSITVLLSIFNVWILPKERQEKAFSWKRLGSDIDWIGVVISSTTLGIFSYIFAAMTGSLSNMRQIPNIVLLCIAVTMIPAFGWWMRRQESLGKPALIPNSIWTNIAFTSICIMVIISWAVLDSMEVLFSLFFQEVQELSVLQTSLRFLPNVIFGIILNIGTGLLVHRIRADHLVLLATALSAISPLIMAIINAEWSWWLCAFWAVLLVPLSADVIFTIANLLISHVFPPNTQALAGAVFNTVAQFGTSMGLAITAVISASVTNKSQYPLKNSPDALMVGYRAVYWACFGAMVLAFGIGAFGLRKVGKVGLKRD